MDAARIAHGGSTAEELLALGHTELECHMTGHNWLVANKGRVNFSASDVRRYAPEARQPVRLRQRGADGRGQTQTHGLEGLGEAEPALVRHGEVLAGVAHEVAAVDGHDPLGRQRELDAASQAVLGIVQLHGSIERVGQALQQQARAEWLRHPVRPAARCRVGVLGFGAVGQAIARAFAPLGYEVTIYDGDKRAGGMIRSQIPRFRLPEEVIDEEVGGTGAIWLCEHEPDLVRCDYLLNEGDERDLVIRCLEDLAR